MAENQDNPSYQNAAYRQMIPGWRIVDDVAPGTLSLRSAGSLYLPMEPAEDPLDFQSRVSRAIFFNAFDRTVNGLVGMVFRKEPTFEADVPAEIAGTETTEGHGENIDNAGTHWTVFARERFTAAIRDGHSFIYVDMPPPLPPGATRADELAANRRPYWIAYDASQAVNWRTEQVNGQTRLAQITFREITNESAGQFAEEEITRYRVLRPGSWELWREAETGGQRNWILEDAGVSTLPEIPVAVIYGRKTGYLTSRPPLLDLALINLAHYQKYSDYSVYLHLASRPILWFRGRDANRKIETIGPRTFFDVDSNNGHVAFAETTGASLGAAKEDLHHLEEQMAALGLSIIAGKAPQANTATEELLDQVQEESDLAAAARSLKDGVELALGFHAAYLGLNSGGSINLGSTMQELTLSPEEMRVWIESAGNLFSRDTIYRIFSRAGKLPEDFDAQSESQLVEAEAEARAVRAEQMFNRGADAI